MKHFDKLYCVAQMLRDVLDDLYFSTGNDKQESDYVEQSG